MVLITDRLEACGGNLETVGEELKVAGTDITLDIVRAHPE